MGPPKPVLGTPPHCSSGPSAHPPPGGRLGGGEGEGSTLSPAPGSHSLPSGISSSPQPVSPRPRRAFLGNVLLPPLLLMSCPKWPSPPPVSPSLSVPLGLTGCPHCVCSSHCFVPHLFWFWGLCSLPLAPPLSLCLCQSLSNSVCLTSPAVSISLHPISVSGTQ